MEEVMNAKEPINIEVSVKVGDKTGEKHLITVDRNRKIDESASTKTLRQNSETSTYRISTLGGFVNVLLSFLIASAISAIPLLLNTNTAIFYTSQPLYIMVVFLFVSLVLFRYWGLLIGALALLVCVLIVDIPLKVNIVNAFSNMLQLVLMYGAFVFIQFIERRRDRINVRKNSLTTKWHKTYEFVLIILAIAYVLYYLFAESINNTVIYVLAISCFVYTIITSIVRRDLHYFSYTGLIALIPSLLASVLSAIFSEVPKDLMWAYVGTWTASNYILMQSVGYLVFMHYESWEVEFYKNKEVKSIDVSSICYYIAALLWNIFVIYLFRHDVFAGKSYMYFFPWALGNFLLLSNLIFSTFDDAKGATDYFKWYEDRVVVVEKKTSVIITIISFLLPLSGVLTKVNVPDILTFIFIANIFCACFSVGLIWVPKSNIKFIALLKTIKSIFYTYSLIFLLMSAIMIMYTYKYQLVALPG